MFCQYCGLEATQETNYCKRCGGNLNPLANLNVQQVAPRPVSTLAVWGIGLTTLLLVVGGLIVLFGFTMELAGKGVPPPALAFLALFGAITLFGSVWLLMRLFGTLLGGAHTPPPQAVGGPFNFRRPTATSELPPRSLPEAHDYVPSVTEHTTRVFEQQQKKL